MIPQPTVADATRWAALDLDELSDERAATRVVHEIAEARRALDAAWLSRPRRRRPAGRCIGGTAAGTSPATSPGSPGSVAARSGGTPTSRISWPMRRSWPTRSPGAASPRPRPRRAGPRRRSPRAGAGRPRARSDGSARGAGRLGGPSGAPGARRRRSHRWGEPRAPPRRDRRRRSDRVRCWRPPSTWSTDEHAIQRRRCDAAASAAGVPAEHEPERRSRRAARTSVARVPTSYLDHADDLPTSSRGPTARCCSVGRDLDGTRGVPHAVARPCSRSGRDHLGRPGVAGWPTNASISPGIPSPRADAEVLDVVTLRTRELCRPATRPRGRWIARDRHCRYRGCTSPPWACDVHHLVRLGQRWPDRVGQPGAPVLAPPCPRAPGRAGAARVDT